LGRTPAARYGCSRGVNPTTQPSGADPYQPSLFDEFPTAERREEFEFSGGDTGADPGTFHLRGHMRTFAQENPTANEAILGTRLRQLVKHFGLNVAVDQSDEIPAKPKIRQVGAKRGQDESETKKNKFPERQSVTADQAEEILSEQENLAKRPCAICAKYNPKFKGKHSAEKCWDNPANADKPRWWEQRNKKPRATERATDRSIRIGNGLKTEVEFIITPDIQEEAILGMDVLGKETGFAILPERERLKIGNLEWKLAKGRSGPEIRRIDTEDPLREEEAYGVPPLPETREARDQRKKT
jgi:hypothetical protein